MSQYLKSKLLEYITRRILTNCGFSSVLSDGLYIYDRNPLQMINGKGAAHDADVLMNPPIQMPFTYPIRIIFECKAYLNTRKIGLNIVRNALGFRNDINDFEIITEDFLRWRQNNRRMILAVSDRKRHYYQVGISTLFDFSKPSLEFAANNKIPLLSMSELFAGTNLAETIDSIPSNIEDLIGQIMYNSIIREFSIKNIANINFDTIREICEENEILSQCYEIIDSVVNDVYVGLLESGEILFIKKDSNENDILSNNQNHFLTATIHWSERERERWWFNFNETETRYYFYLPREIARAWKGFNDVRTGALDIKEQNFARFFIFNKGNSNQNLPFKMVTLDIQWLNEMASDL